MRRVKSLLPQRKGATARSWLLGLLGVVLLIVFVGLELLLLRSYHETESTTREFKATTDATTALANVQREALLLDRTIVLLTPGRRTTKTLADAKLRRDLLQRQLDVLASAGADRAPLQWRIRRIRLALAHFDGALASRQRGRMLRALDTLDVEVKQTFDDEEHLLYDALGETLHERSGSQRLAVLLSLLALIMAVVLAAVIWRAVRGSFARAYDALATEAAEREELQEKLWHQATHDSLTGLPNRMMFQRDLEEARGVADKPAAVLYMDLDGFKSVNDTLGHEAGDGLLQAVAGRIAQGVRPDDRVARLGGDEFAVLLPEVAGEAEALETAERLRAAVTAPWSLGGRTIRVGASAGVALCADGLYDPDELIANADLAMYAAKHAGKGSVRLYDETMREAAQGRAQLETELRGALDGGELEVHYQPVVDLATEELLGLEALIRWRHPERGLLQPDEFLPLAEQVGLIVPIGRWVLQQACGDATSWLQDRPDLRAPWVSVNVAPTQIEDPGLSDDVRRALRASGLDPGRLVLEISERTALAGGAHPGSLLAELHEIGIRVALDDFGTGHTSLSSLRFLAVNILKLDKSFIDEVDKDEKRERLVAVVLELAATLGLETVAEGIERPDQLEVLRGLDCGMGQGFLFSRAVPADQVPLLLPSDASIVPLRSAVL